MVDRESGLCTCIGKTESRVDRDDEETDEDEDVSRLESARDWERNFDAVFVVNSVNWSERR